MTPPASDLQRARSALLAAELTPAAHERFLAAHGVALQVAAVVLAHRPRRAPRADRPRNTWLVLYEAAPELAEWAAFFAATSGRRDAVRAAVDAGDPRARLTVSAREADDLVRDAAAFLAIVEARVGSAAAVDEHARGRVGQAWS